MQFWSCKETDLFRKSMQLWSCSCTLSDFKETEKNMQLRSCSCTLSDFKETEKVCNYDLVVVPWVILKKQKQYPLMIL